MAEQKTAHQQFWPRILRPNATHTITALLCCHLVCHNRKKSGILKTPLLLNLGSGRPDSNWRPHAPQTCTLTNCATSRKSRQKLLFREIGYKGTLFFQQNKNPRHFFRRKPRFLLVTQSDTSSVVRSLISIINYQFDNVNRYPNITSYTLPDCLSAESDFRSIRAMY